MKTRLQKLAAVLCCGILSAAACSSVIGTPCCIHASSADEIAHDPSRDVQKDGVGNPFNFGERNTPADGAIADNRAINHEWSVQQVKYALYKEIDEHWDLISVRFGQRDREKVYALFLGIGTLESTLGGNGDGCDLETAFNQGFPGSSAHAYGTLQTAVTAFKDGPDSEYMQESDVPEMEWYDLNESNFFDGIISNHMGIRKIIHFIRSAIVDYDLKGWQIVRGALKGHNTGWANYTGDNDGYYANYPDEGCALAQWYYEEGHLYDNVFTWTKAEVAAKQRAGNPWEDWWYDIEPSLAEIPQQPESTETTSSPNPNPLLGDVNLNGEVTLEDAVLLSKAICTDADLNETQAVQADMNTDRKINAVDLTLLKRYLIKN